MRKDYCKDIIKNLKRGRNMKGIYFMPTLEEADYLQSKGVDCTIVRTTCHGLATGTEYLVEATCLELVK